MILSLSASAEYCLYKLIDIEVPSGTNSIQYFQNIGLFCMSFRKANKDQTIGGKSN